MDLNIKFWIEGPPPIDLVRPETCRGCGQAGAPLGQSVQLVGHGVRTRMLVEPGGPGDGPVELVLFLRRFRCRNCGSVVTVAPREVVTRRRYSACAIALALVLFGVDRLSSGRVLERLKPGGPQGYDQRRWRVLDRWVSAMREGRVFRLRHPPPCEAPTVRSAAAIFARQLAAFSRKFAGPLEELAVDGAMMAIAS